MVLMNHRIEKVRPALSRTELQKLGERMAEAAQLPIDGASKRTLGRSARQLAELQHQALGHFRNRQNGRFECPQQVCLHPYEEDHNRLARTAELAEQAADILDQAPFHYRWDAHNPPGPAAALYSSRRPHIAGRLRAGAKRIRDSLE